MDWTGDPSLIKLENQEHSRSTKSLQDPFELFQNNNICIFIMVENNICKIIICMWDL
jgi:hypothetical protein